MGKAHLFVEIAISAEKLWFLVEMRFLSENVNSYRKRAQKPSINHREYWCFCTWAPKVRKSQKLWKLPRRIHFSVKIMIFTENWRFSQKINFSCPNLKKTAIPMVFHRFPSYFSGRKRFSSKKSIFSWKYWNSTRNPHFSRKSWSRSWNHTFHQKLMENTYEIPL